MNKKYFTSELYSLKKTREKARKHLDNTLEKKCRLRFYKGGYVGIYEDSGRRKDGTYKQTYIPLHSPKATRIVNSKYCKELIQHLDVEIEALENFLKDYHPENKFKIYEKYKEKFGDRIIPLLVSHEDFARDWEKQAYRQYDGFPEGKTIPTLKGDMVRSKSEAAIADYLYTQGIPYRYEPVIIFNGKTYYPDFVICSPYNGKFYILEHFGQFDDLEYCRRNVKKIQELSMLENVKNQIWFFETKEVPLDMRAVENVIFQKLNLDTHGVKKLYS